ncbi:hypothetical protein I3760_13G175100, partial [Carya illinoinensis]
FVKQVYFGVGDGSRIRFWFDVWCGESALFRAFPNFFRLAVNQQASMSQMMSFSNEEVHWNVCFFRSVQDWEIEEVTDFFKLLYSVAIRRHERDHILWKNTETNKFSVGSFYKMMNGQHNFSFPWKNIWKVCVPSKVSFFV